MGLWALVFPSAKWENPFQAGVMLSQCASSQDPGTRVPPVNAMGRKAVAQ